MAPSPSNKKRLKRKVGDTLKEKRRGIIRKPKPDSWFDFTGSPWFKSFRAFLMADSFAYGPLTQEVPKDRANLPDMKTVLKDVLVDSPRKVLKDAFMRTPGILKDALITRPRKVVEGAVDSKHFSEENQSVTGGGGQVVHNIHIDGDTEGVNMMQKQIEAETEGQVVRSRLTTIQREVVTTNTYHDNELGERKSVPVVGPPHSPTVDTELTDQEELEGDEEQSHVGDENAPLDFDKAEMVSGKLIKNFGGRFSEDLGIHVDAGDEEVERWFLAANLFSRSLPFNVSKQTYKGLMALGVFKTTDFLNAEEAKVTELFERTGYTKYGQRVTTHFRKLAYQMRDEMGGQVSTLKHTADPVELIRRLRALNGVKLSAVHSFMRELRGIWRACDPDFDNRTKKAAVHLKLLGSAKPANDPEDVLMKFAREAEIDARDLEVACFKLGAEHEKDYGNCKGGPECEVLSSHDRFLSSLP